MTFKAYNHNNTLLGEFSTHCAAQKEARLYTEMSGNAAYVSGEPKESVSKIANTDTLTSLVKDLQHSADSQNKRMARIETRLSRLMLHVGMKTDGRNDFITEKKP
jgi:hypothetical protein